MLTRVWLAALVLLAASLGAQAEPLSKASADAVRAAIASNWMIPVGIPNLERYTVSLRLYMTPESKVTKMEVLDDTGDQGFRTLAESARRAILMTQNELGRLPIPPEEYSPTVVVRWPMKVLCEQHGGC